MSVPTTREKQAHRLAHKTLRDQLYAAFENDYGYEKGRTIAHAIVDDIVGKVKAFYEPKGGRSPHQISYIAADAKAKVTSRRSMAQTPQTAVVLTMLAPEDCAAYEQGAPVLLQQRFVRWLNEAKDQGALLTTADLALLCGLSCGTVERRIRDYEQQTGKLLPLRGTVHDASSKLTHKARIVQLYLSGKLPDEIAVQTDHSLRAVENYLRHFQLVRELSDRYDAQGISGLLQCGQRLVCEYLALLPPRTEAHEAPGHKERDTPVGEPSVSPSQAPTSLPGAT